MMITIEPANYALIRCDKLIRAQEQIRIDASLEVNVFLLNNSNKLKFESGEDFNVMFTSLAKNCHTLRIPFLSAPSTWILVPNSTQQRCLCVAEAVSEKTSVTQMMPT